MKTLKIAYLELRLVLTDRWSVFWMLILPFIMIYFFAKAFPQAADPSRTTVGLEVLVQDDGFLGEMLVEDLEEEGFEIRRIESLKERGQNWLGIVIIPEGFTAKILRGENVKILFEVAKRRDPSALEAARIKIYKAAGRIIGNLCLVEAGSGGEGADAGDLEAQYRRVASLEPRVALDSSFAGKGRVIPGGYNQTVPGMIVMSVILLVMTYGTGLIAYDRRIGMLRRLATTPCRRWEILTGKMCGRILMGVIQITILLLVCSLFLGFYLGNSLLGWLLCLVPYTLACGALGMFIGCLFRNEDQVGTVGWIPPILMAALGGCWWPRELVPDYLNYIGYLFPPAWAMDALHRLISFGGDAASVLPQSAALCGFFALFMTLCIRCIRFD